MTATTPNPGSQGEPVMYQVRCSLHPGWRTVRKSQFEEYIQHGWEGRRLYDHPPQGFCRLHLPEEGHHPPTLTEIGAFLKRCDPYLVREYVDDDLNLKIALQESLEAQAVDLGRFRKLASWVANCAGHGINDSQRRLGEELLALIDNYEKKP